MWGLWMMEPEPLGETTRIRALEDGGRKASVSRHAFTSEHINIECSARWQRYWDDVALLLPADT